MVVIMVMLVLVVVVIAKLKLNLKMVVFCHMCQPARNIEPFFTLWRFNLKMHRQDCFLQSDWYGGDGQNAIWRKWWWWPLMITKWWCDKQGPSNTFEDYSLQCDWYWDAYIALGDVEILLDDEWFSILWMRKHILLIFFPILFPILWMSKLFFPIFSSQIFVQPLKLEIFI